MYVSSIVQYCRQKYSWADPKKNCRSYPLECEDVQYIIGARQKLNPKNLLLLTEAYLQLPLYCPASSVQQPTTCCFLIWCEELNNGES
jgi:hypothetical protein